MDNSQTTTVLIFVGNYLPGYKAGGIIRNIVNTVGHLRSEFDFKIITRDRDLDDDKPYDNIKIDDWQLVGGVMVYYLSKRKETFKGLRQIINSTQHDLIMLNSFFDPITIKILFNRRLKTLLPASYIVSPFGEFAKASLKQKNLKKIIFIKLAKLIGLYKNVTWRVSSKFEQADVLKVMGIKESETHITGDLPRKDLPEINYERQIEDNIDLKIIFLSRISKEKKLDYALKVLSQVKKKIQFDIYGPLENQDYWKECKSLLKNLPQNISATYKGNVNGEQVLNIFAEYDLFLFPTGGEAYGNVIAESLTVGTPVLISTETPWRNLADDGLGWDVPLNQIATFVERIEDFAKLDSKEMQKQRAIIKNNIQTRLFDPFVFESNKALFNIKNNKT